MEHDLKVDTSVETTKPAPGMNKARLWRPPGKLTSGHTDVILLFLVSRGVLTIIGVLSLTLLPRMIIGRMDWEHPPYNWLDIWGQWDSGWYLDIAKNWYAAEPRYADSVITPFFQSTRRS